jgi:hypothetical protein
MGWKFPGLHCVRRQRQLDQWVRDQTVLPNIWESAGRGALPKKKWDEPDRVEAAAENRCRKSFCRQSLLTMVIDNRSPQSFGIPDQYLPISSANVPGHLQPLYQLFIKIPRYSQVQILQWLSPILTMDISLH